MKISILTSPSLINLDLKSLTKEQVFKELAEMLLVDKRISDAKGFIGDLKIRESLGSTGIGLGIAIPHAKSSFVDSPSLVFGRSMNGIEFESLDGEPAKLFFMIAMPESGSNMHLKALALLSRSLIHENFRNRLYKAKTNEDVIKILESIDSID
ncbi:MAG TPA: PTS fructose transporter subunit IIA [Acholeplasmataceae bacterium]|nr:PTS fructose transporter subunit IIA [Acholeplasmataceae bacterium]HBY64854.1 PTS fructose transporter subunit IIA [Acholeplasmataceae bacterium]